MLITSRFVILNLPKSGSSFVRSVVKAIYRRRCAGRGRLARWLPGGAGPDCALRELMLPNIRLPGGARDQHGTAAQIPRRYRDRAIVSVVRDPYDKAVSEYRFRWWATHPPLAAAVLHEHFPAFPDLDFDEFLRLWEFVAARKAATLGAPAPADIGNLTVEFVQFFFRDPAAVLARLDDGYLASGAFRADMVPVAFLRQEQLNAELAEFLAGHGFAADEVAVARDHPPVNVTAGDGALAVAWSAGGLARFAHGERYLLAMLGALGFRYPAPLALRGDNPVDRP